MNGDFVLGQLRLALTAFIAYAGGKGWFTPADSTLALAMLTSLGPLIAPWLLSIYSNYGTKKVPQSATAIQSVEIPHGVVDASQANKMGPDIAVVAGKIVGALLLAVILLAPRDASAQPLTASSCDPYTIFKGLTPQNFLPRIKTCTDDDLKGALDDANTSPVDNAALACLNPLQTLRAGIIKGGVLTGFQAFRRAKLAGLISGCTNWVNSTVLLP